MMGEHQGSLMLAILSSILLFVITLVFNGLAGPGIYPFLGTTANISGEYETEITPAGWTFAIWSLIYVWLVLMFVYILSGCCRKNSYGYVYCSPPVLSHGFFMAWCMNMGLNTAWLFLWDRSLMIVAAVFLLLIAGSNYIMISFACRGLHVHGAWLSKYHRLDLWLHRVCVQNGLALYATWTTVATLVNLTIVLDYDAEMLPENAATVTLSVLTCILLAWCVLENWVLERHVRYIVTVYPVVIWALCGAVSSHFDPSAPSQSGLFLVALLALSCALCAVKLGLAVWRHVKRPLYQDVKAEDMEPMEIAQRQKKIFK
ncbi:unnamed protein product [Boreogadus saida]